MAKKSKVGMTVETLGGYLREQRVSAGVSLRQLADQAGVSNPYLSQIERGLRRPSAEVLQQLARALRISAEQLYVQAGILNPDEDEIRSVELAVLADPVLTNRQKQALIEVYEAFRFTSEGLEEDPDAEADGDLDEDAESSAAPDLSTTTPDDQPAQPGLANTTEGN